MARKKTHCKSGHPRTPDNVYKSGGCIICALAQSAANNLKQKEVNPEKVRENNRKASLKWKENHPERARAIEVAIRNGLDLEAVYRYLLERGNVMVCDICQQECPTGNSLSLDHNHETSEIRGLLCKKCNTGLGMFNDSIKLMEIATDYLREKV
jgi:hypothetical protein